MATCMSFTVQAVKNLGARGWSLGMASIIYIIFAVLFSYLSTQKLFLRIGLHRVIPMGMIVHFLYCILVPNMTTVAGIYGCQILAAASMGFLFTGLTSESMKGIPASHNSTAMGIFQAVYAVGMTLFPMITGRLMNGRNLKSAYYFMAGCVVIGFLSVVLFYIKENCYGFCKKAKWISGKRG